MKIIKNFFEKQRDIGILIMRIGIGIGFIFVHGLGKITGGAELWEKLGGAMANIGIKFMPVFWGFMAALAEFGGGILILLGLFTRTASAFSAFTMFIAMITHLAKQDPWRNVIYPAEMLAVFVCLMFIGAGKYSIDFLISKNKS
jgi:putative oxidoreductase